MFAERLFTDEGESVVGMVSVLLGVNDGVLDNRPVGAALGLTVSAFVLLKVELLAVVLVTHRLGAIDASVVGKLLGVSEASAVNSMD